jgi:hypothetical protein
LVREARPEAQQERVQLHQMRGARKKLVQLAQVTGAAAAVQALVLAPLEEMQIPPVAMVAMDDQAQLPAHQLRMREEAAAEVDLTAILQPQAVQAVLAVAALEELLLNFHAHLIMEQVVRQT